jgi:hypothetical protein
MLRTALTALLVLSSAAAGHAGIIGALTFTDPTGLVAPTDSIDVYLTLTLDPSSDPLKTDGSANVLGLTPADIAPYLFGGLPAGVDENSLTNSNLNVAFGCGTTFTTICTSGPPYDFNFNLAFPTLVGPASFDLEPGMSTQILLGTFTPTGGAAPPGTYEFDYAAVFIQVYDANLLNDPNDPSSGWLHIADVPISDTATTGSTFTRTVLGGGVPGVPEPGVWAMTLGGLGVLAGFARKRR